MVQTQFFPAIYNRINYFYFNKDLLDANSNMCTLLTNITKKYTKTYYWELFSVYTCFPAIYSNFKDNLISIIRCYNNNNPLPHSGVLTKYTTTNYTKTYCWESSFVYTADWCHLVTFRPSWTAFRTWSSGCCCFSRSRSVSRSCPCRRSTGSRGWSVCGQTSDPAHRASPVDKKKGMLSGFLS